MYFLEFLTLWDDQSITTEDAIKKEVMERVYEQDQEMHEKEQQGDKLASYLVHRNNIVQFDIESKKQDDEVDDSIGEDQLVVSGLNSG